MAAVFHLAHFVPRFPPALGGCEAYVARLGDYLAHHGDRVRVWTSTALDLEAMWHPGRREWPTTEEERAPLPAEVGQTVRRFRPLRFPGRRYLLKAVSLIPVPPLQAFTLPCNPVCPAMWHEAGRDDGPLDAVHAFAFPHSFPILCALRLARRRKVPFLLTPFLHLGDPHDPSDRTRRQYTTRPLRWLIRQADRVFVQTPSEFDAVARLGIPPERIILQGLGVDPRECTGGDRAAVRQAWGIRPGEVVVGHLANLSAEKGTVDLLRAVEQVWGSGVPIHLILAGPEMPNFRRVWDRCPMRERVTKLGRLSEEQKRDFFAGIDAFALPSRTDSFGLVLLEAWANGHPVLCYRAGGPADLVRDEQDGLLVRCGDVAGLAAGLTRLAANPGWRAHLGATGQQRVATEFRWSDRLERVRETIVSVARAHPRRGVGSRRDAGLSLT